MLDQADQALLTHLLVVLVTLNLDLEQVAHLGQPLFLEDAPLESLLDRLAPRKTGICRQASENEESVVAEPFVDVLQKFWKVGHKVQGEIHDDQVDRFIKGLPHVILSHGLNDPALERIGVHNHKPTLFAHFGSLLDKLVRI